jgi:hypothetical protein
LAPPVDADGDADGEGFPDDDRDEFDDPPERDEIDDDWSLELDGEYWDALIPDDDYEPQPDERDFWTDAEAA